MERKKEGKTPETGRVRKKMDPKERRKQKKKKRQRKQCVKGGGIVVKKKKKERKKIPFFFTYFIFCLISVCLSICLFLPSVTKIYSCTSLLIHQYFCLSFSLSLFCWLYICRSTFQSLLSVNARRRNVIE